MAEYGVYAQPDSDPVGYRCMISVAPGVVGTNPGQITMFEAIQRSTPVGIPFGVFEYPSEQYPETFDFDNWYPTPEETAAGIGTQGA